MPVIKLASTAGAHVVVDTTDLTSGANITTRIQAAQALVPNGGLIEVPSGSWVVNVNTITLASGQYIRAARVGGTTLTTNTGASFVQHSVFSIATGARNVGVSGFVISTTNSDYRAVSGGNDIQNVVVSDLTLTNCRAIQIGGFGYSSQNDTNYCRNIVVERCHGTSTGTITQGQGQFIYFNYVMGFRVRDCSSWGYQHGFQGQGGGASTAAEAGDDYNSGEKKCGFGLIDNCQFGNCGASVWFTMCRNVQVTECFGDRCSDAAFDAESCWFIDFVRCHARDPGSDDGVGKAGACFTVFFGARDIRFIDCIGEFVTTTTSDVTETSGQTTLRYRGGKGSYFFMAFGGAVTAEAVSAKRQQNVQIIGGNFRAATFAKDGKFPKIATFRTDVADGSPIWDFTVDGATIVNGGINIGYATNNKQGTVKNCKIEWRTAAYVVDSMLRMVGQNYVNTAVGAGQRVDGFEQIIDNNRFHFHAVQPTGTRAIEIQGPGALVNFTNTYVITRNKFYNDGSSDSNAQYGIRVLNTSNGSSYNLIIYAGDNIFSDTYADSGTAVSFNDTSSGRGTIWVNLSRNITRINRRDVPSYTLATRPSALVPSAVTGTNTFTVPYSLTADITAYDESQITVGSIIRIAGITSNSGVNNGKWLVSALGSGSGTKTITVTKVDGTSAGLTNETPTGTPTLVKVVPAGRRTKLRSATFTTLTRRLANTGMMIQPNERYEVITSDTELSYFVQCQANDVLDVYAWNGTDQDIDAPLKNIDIIWK